uniref:Ras-related protein Rab-13-like n=1 Tax=Dermatophagoides pteronyssinus TaxID=6956 RepID=A0A6P6Y3J4_DERPT|nr:ras-related protein Rab-13-like [Dermatophagoides pteronyssinus]
MDSTNRHHQIILESDSSTTSTSIVSTSKPISGKDIINIRMISGRTIDSTTIPTTTASHHHHHHHHHQQAISSTAASSAATDATAIVPAIMNTTTVDTIIDDIRIDISTQQQQQSTSQQQQQQQSSLLLTTSNTRIAKTSKTKFLILGAAKVGKTLLLRRMQNINWPFINDTSLYNATIGPDLHRLKCGNIEAIDIGGQQRYMPIAKKYCELFQTFVIVFDLTDMNTFLAAKDWLEFIHTHHLIKPKRIILIGNKIDLENERKISKNLGKNLAMTYDGDYHEISAKMDLTMDKIIDALENNNGNNIVGDNNNSSQNNDKNNSK